MGKTLHEVIPGCMSERYLDAIGTTKQPTSSLVHVEAGKRIYQLYAELDTPADLEPDAPGALPKEETLARYINRRYGNRSFARSWAFETLGGAGGQTIVGALSTGTHGGDFTLPPIADSVVALHLVADGGKHYWIEPSPRYKFDAPPLVDDNKLTACYGKAVFGGPKNFEIIRDSAVFNAVLVSVGRFGIIYSVVMRAVSQYVLHEERRLDVWQDFKHLIKNLNGPLYSQQSEPNEGKSRFLQIAISLTPHSNFQRNLAGITKRWQKTSVSADPQGQKERVGEMGLFDERIQGPLFAHAGRNHPYRHNPDNPLEAADRSLLERACADASFLQGILKAVIEEIQTFVTSNGAAVSAGIGAVAVAGGIGLAALIPWLLLILLILEKILDEMDGDDRFGEFMEGVKNKLLDPDEKDPLKRAAGLFVWQLLVYKAFESEQKAHDFDAISYAMMDRKDYLNISCEVNVDSVEVFFDAVDDRLITFVDALIAYEIMQEFKGLAFAGYAALRFMGPSSALIGMQKHHVTCSVEVACLRDVTGSQELVDYAVTLARNPTINGLLHWGQRNDYTMADVEHRYGNSLTDPGGDLGTWRQVLSRITANGRLDGFSSNFTRHTGLEVVQPSVQQFTIDRLAVSIGEMITLKWNCLDNPPDSRVSILFSRPTTGSTVINTMPLAGQHHIQVTEPGTHIINFYVTRKWNGVHRQDSRTAFITVA